MEFNLIGVVAMHIHDRANLTCRQAQIRTISPKFHRVEQADHPGFIAQMPSETSGASTRQAEARHFGDHLSGVDDC